MTYVLLQLFFAIGFVALACFITYKITLPLCLKIIDLGFESPLFRIGICIFLSVFFLVGGMFQLIDFLEEAKPTLAWFFPLSFLVAGIFVFLALRTHHLTK